MFKAIFEQLPAGIYKNILVRMIANFVERNFYFMKFSEISTIWAVAPKIVTGREIGLAHQIIKK